MARGVDLLDSAPDQLGNRQPRTGGLDVQPVVHMWAHLDMQADALRLHGDGVPQHRLPVCADSVPNVTPLSLDMPLQIRQN
jgi:hypothetical protein